VPATTRSATGRTPSGQLLLREYPRENELNTLENGIQKKEERAEKSDIFPSNTKVGI